MAGGRIAPTGGGGKAKGYYLVRFRPEMNDPGVRLSTMASRSPSGEDARAGRRRHSRLRVCLPARLITLDGTLTATLLDVSFRGAKVVVATQPGLRVGASAVLTWAGFEMFCTVAWTRPDLLGLDFDTPLKPQVLIATRDLADATPRQDPGRLAAREWVSGQVMR